MERHSEGGMGSGPRRPSIRVLARWPRWGSWRWALLWLALGLLRSAWAADAGEVVSVLGQADVLREGRWQAVAPGEVLAVGETVKTAADSRIALQLTNGSQIKLNANSHLELKQLTPRAGLAPTAGSPPHNLLRLLGGEAWVRSTAIPLEIQTTMVIATIRGTEFTLAVAGEAARLAVVAGEVEFHNPQGRVSVGPREQATARRGEAPRKTVLLDPLDAVQWSLYYPGLISYRDYPLAAAAPTDGETRFDAGDRDGARQAFTRALQRDPRDPRARTGLGWVLLESGQTEAALAELQQVRPPTLMSLVGAANALYRLSRLSDADRAIAAAQARDPRAPLPWVQAALNHLVRGRIPDAHRALDEALARDPQQALALSLRANIYLVQNRTADALAAARQAVAAQPASPTAHLSQSAAHQAHFDLDAALAAARQARALDPQNPQALIQESRLLFGMGRLTEATALAQAARQRAPHDALISSTWGFLQLARHHPDQARHAFEAAVAQDSTLGEPHLGLGLVLFRHNQPQAATAELEKATLLEPQVSLYNSYLGKAYLELNNDALAQKYFAQAAQLDPRDPTPHFYDALRLQAANQPTQAVQALQRSINLNNNRAVYRSHLLLDQDLAARGVALGRIYNEVGFEQLSLYEARKSLTSDPANYSAHRLLSDSYAILPRHEIARASELLQSQLLQPINITPIQPQLAETKLGILTATGPVTPSLHEYNSLFLRDRSSLALSGLVGNQDTLSDEVILNGIYDRFSYSLGHFHYQTNGFRENNDFEHDIYNLFTQLAVTPDFSLQAELRRRDTEQGDLRQYFSFEPDTKKRIKIRQDTARLGARYTPSPQSNLILSLIHADREEEHEFPDYVDNDKGTQIEGQYLFREAAYNFIVGGGTSKTTRKDDDLQNSKEREHKTAYSYANITLLKDMTWTAGLSYDHLQDEIEGINLDQFNPKLGFRWTIADNLQLRLASFSTLKRALIVEQTIEPTQIAGFDQFYDDLNSTKAKVYAIGLDTQFNKELYGGIQGIHRDLEVPFPDLFNNKNYQAEKEEKILAYLYWMPHPHWAIQYEYQFEKYDAKPNLAHIETISLPLVVRYFNPSGFFAELGATYVWQQFTGLDLESMDLRSKTDNNDFIVVNTVIGFRLPKQQGSFSLEISNLFDKEFKFEDMSFRNSHKNPENPRFIPDRTIFSRITLNF